jgi:hypothetical protein
MNTPWVDEALKKGIDLTKGELAKPMADRKGNVFRRLLRRYWLNAIAE